MTRPFRPSRAAKKGRKSFFLALKLPVPGALLLLAFTPALAPGLAAQGWKDSLCLKCHGDKKICTNPESYRLAMVRAGNQRARKRPPDFVEKLYLGPGFGLKGPHKGVSCASCHEGIQTIPHDRYLPPPAGCGRCHAKETKAYGAGIHGMKKKLGDPLAPSCGDCHGPTHQVLPAADPASPVHPLNISRTCGSCHARKELVERNKAKFEGRVKNYWESVHGKGLSRAGLVVSATCADCHGDHKILPSENPASPTNKANIENLCEKCHLGLKEKLAKSVHGRAAREGNPNAPNCQTCHESHKILSTEDRTGFPMGTPGKCGSCHKREFKSYLMSFHGKANRFGMASAALCIDCHEHHDILPPTDPKSSVSPGRLLQTCRRCHPKAKQNFIYYHPHADFRNKKKYPIEYWAWFIMTTLLVSTIAFFGLHTVLWFIREAFYIARHGRHSRRKNPVYIQRYPLYHRLTHLVIIVSFLGLTATGMPLKFADSSWASSVMHFFGGPGVARAIHRFCAFLTLVYVLMHLGYLGRSFWKTGLKKIGRFFFGPDSMVFSLKDLKDMVGHFKWFLFLGPRPKFDKWTYWDKFDYWGEFWGVTVIGLSGLFLWFPEFFSRFLPGWIFNVALVVHSIEALLAASIIFLVHFFNVHLRPSKFPLDPVIFTGCMTEEEFAEEHPLEYERLLVEGELEKKTVEFKWGKRFLLVRILGISAFMVGLLFLVLIFIGEIQSIFGNGGLK